MNFYFLFFYVILLLIVHFDSTYAHPWFSFTCYGVILISASSYAFIKAHRDSLKKLFHDISDIKALFLLISVSIVLNIFAISQYPFVHLGDGIRDTGLDGMEIASGRNTDLFGWGHYNAQSNIIGIITSFSYRIFGASTWTYLSLTLLIGTLNVCLIYLLLRYIQKNRLVALLGGLTLSVIPHNLFFVRTELVDIFDVFWTIVLLFCYFLTSHKKTVSAYMFLGLLIGFAATFHTPSRIFGALILIFTFFGDSYSLLRNLAIKQLQKYGNNLIHLTAFIIIGYGPLILQTTPEIFTQKAHLAGLPLIETISKNSLDVMRVNYINSIQDIFYKPVVSRMPGFSLIPIPFAIMCMLGLIYILIKARKEAPVLWSLMIMMPFTHSAITDAVGADHRLLAVVPICVICIAYWYRFVLTTKPFKYVHGITTFLICIYFAYVSFTFFASKNADITRTPSQFLFEHAMRTISHNQMLKKSRHLCLNVSSMNAGEFDLAHYRELKMFLFPESNMVINGDQTMHDNEVLINPYGCGQYFRSTQELVTRCNKNFSWGCPSSYMGELIVKY